MRPRSPSIAAVPILALLLSWGCSADGPDIPREVVVRDSAGIRIVESPMPESLPIVLAGPEPILEIGVMEGEDAYQLFQVTDVATLADGRTVVANGGTREVRYFDALGTYLMTVGGEGEGPDEFGYPMAVLPLAGNTIQVTDRYDRVRFDGDGGYVDRVAFDRGRWQAQWSPEFAESAEWLPDGALFAPILDPIDSAPQPSGPFRPRQLLIRVAADLSRADTLGVYGGIEREYVDVGVGAARVVVPPFGASSSWSTQAGDGTVAVGDNRNPEVHLFGPDGSRTWVRWAAQAEPVTAADVEAWKDEQRRVSWNQPHLALLERGWAEITLPETKPFFHRVNLALDGAPWVGLDDYFGDPAAWLVFDAEGVLQGRFAVPGPFTIYEIGPDYVLGVFRDRNDVEYVRKYRLVPAR